jgi:segregation and condensation protein B
MSTDPGQLQRILEAALLAAARPLDLDELLALFPEQERPDRTALRNALADLREQYDSHAMELREVASGYRIQIRSEFTPFVSRLWEERAPRYSRALLETLSIIAYRQPITRADVEDVRGVSLSTSILRTLLDRRWIRAVGHRDVPGRPALYGTTREFLDYFGLKNLDELPPLAELRDVDELGVALELGLSEPGTGSEGHRVRPIEGLGVRPSGSDPMAAPVEAERTSATVTDLRLYASAAARLEPAAAGSDPDEDERAD